MVDQDLDVVVRPDRSWEWKDEDEFAERLAFAERLLGDRRRSAVRAEGERVIDAGRGGRVPVRRHLVRLHPARRSWDVPDELPPGWDRPPVR